MAENSGVDAQVISLPKGGGAIQGLGATFETDLNTGTGGYSVPLNLPAGPNGIRPELSLRYHSAGGNGEFGMGWTLGTVSIARKIEGRIPTYAPDDDQFVLVGVEDLVAMNDGTYRPLVDTMHWRIRRQDSGWELTDTRGTRHVVGVTEHGRIETTENGLLKQACWLLESTLDPAGNSINYAYLSDGPQRYLERVEWGTYSLRFTYEERPDRMSSGRYGFLLGAKLRCSQIELHVTTLRPTLARSWLLEYEQATGSAVSLLRTVLMQGHGGDVSTLPAPRLTFGYTSLQRPSLERFEPAPGTSPTDLGSGDLELIDWNGDGLPDLIEVRGGQARIWPNSGHCRWGPPRSERSLPAAFRWDERGTALADMQGNGTADVVLLDRPLGGYYPLQPGGGFGAPVYWRQAPAPVLEQGSSRLVDLNGDGVVDLLTTGDRSFSLFLREPDGGWRPRPHVVPRPEAPAVAFQDRRVYVADMNGDGLQDLVRVDGGGVTYWPYLGNGRWAAPVRMANRPHLPRDFDPRRVFLVDVDGDGCADLVYVDVDHITYWLNQAGVGLGDPQVIPYTPPARREQIRLADMKGSGTVGVLWSNVPHGLQARGYAYLDLAGGSKPYLLTSIDNGLGLETRIRYRSSTEYALDDAAAGRAWPTFHPFPVHCVAEVELIDEVTHQSTLTRHHYHDGRYDGVARTFLGFGQVDVENVGDAAVPTLLTRNVYHLGLDPAQPTRTLSGDERLRLGALRRRLLRTDILGLDGSPDRERPYQVVHHTYNVRLEPAANGRSVAVPFETRTLEEQLERQATAFATREITYLDIDAHGNILRQRTLVQRAGTAQPDQDITTEVSFAINTDTHVTSLPARVTEKDADGVVLSAAITRYDGPAHDGLPEGQVANGVVTRQESLAISDALATAVYGAAQPDWPTLGYHRLAGETGWWVTQCSYERHDTGAELTLTSRGPRGAEQVLEFDSTRQYPRRVTDALGNVLEGAADERTFQMATLRDPAGLEVVDRIDQLGRVVATVKPGDTDALPTTSFTYRTEVLPVRVTSTHRLRSGEAATLDQVQYFNGRGEAIQQLAPGEGDAGREFIVREAREYSVRGQLIARYIPYYTSSQEYVATVPGRPAVRLRYDALGRLLEQAKASGKRVTQTYAPGRIEMLDEADNASANVKPLAHRLDGLKRVLAVEQHLADRVVSTNYTYDASGRLVAVAHADGGQTRITYDLLGRVLVEQTPDTGRTVYVVDAAGNQAQRSTSSGKTVQSTYDALNRLRDVRDLAAADSEMTYTYLDAADPTPPDGERNRRSRLWQVHDRLGAVTFAYDPLGRVSQTRRGVDRLGRELVTDFVFDAFGREVQVTLPAPAVGAGRRIVQYRYNARGLVNDAPSYVRSANYDVEGRLNRLVYQNGVNEQLDFDAVTGRPTRLRVQAPDHTMLRDQTFTFDDVGNLHQIDSPLPVEAGVFTYDDLDRLTDATYGSGEHFAYQYTDGGRIQRIDGVGDFTYDGLQGSGAVTHAGPNSYTYSADGHLRTAPYGTLEFDAFDNLTGVDLTAGGRLECVYDFRGQRVVRQVVGGRQSIYADPNIEFHNGQALEWVSFAGRRVLAIVGGAGLFLHYDLLATPTLYTAGDGTVARRLAFGPYGTLRSEAGAGTDPPDAQRLAGQPFDPETGLVCFGRRFYDPRLGRFISADRAVGGIYRPDAWDRYAYGHNNPLRFSDPTGRLSGWDILAIIGIVVVVAVLVVLGIFTYGATWAVAGAVINVGGLLIGTAAGVAAGAVLGGIAAARAGQDVWKGVLFGGFIGGVAAFAGGILGPIAGHLAGSVWSSLYFSMAVGGAVQGAVVGAGTGAAVGFAGGAGTAESIWTNIWKGAAIGAVTGALLGLVSAYIQQNPYLQLGLPAKSNPAVAASGDLVDRASYLDSATSFGQGVARGFTGAGHSFGLGSFVGFGAAPVNTALNVSVSWLPTVIMQYGVITAASSTFVGLDKFNIVEFGDVLVFVLEVAPFFIGVFFTVADDAKWDWFKDMKSGLETAFDVGQ